VTTYGVFIGRLSDNADPLDWGGNYTSNLPLHDTPDFPKHGRGDPYRCVMAMISNGRLPGKQVDWGGWAAKVSKQDILAFIAEVYRDDKWDTYPTTRPLPWRYESEKRNMEGLMTNVHSLPEDGLFALVAYET